MVFKTAFALSPPDRVAPGKIPQHTLPTGARVPAIGIGTFGSDRFTGEDIAEAVLGAISVGYRLIDCASVYGNEKLIGEALAAAMAGGVRREDLFVQSKLWNDKHTPADVIPQLKQSLRDLQVEYLDAYFIHWPFPNYHAPGCDVDSRSPDAKPYIHESFMATYRELEKAVELGLIRHIGTSNMTVPKMKLVLRDAKIAPALNEMELHPCFQQEDFFTYLVENKVLPVGFCPIGSPKRPDRDMTDTDVADTEQPAVLQIAKNHGIHPAVVCVKWAVQRGQVPIPFSIHRANYLSNLKATTGDPLTDAEMQLLGTVECGCRLIKGQVFLWKDGQTWEDLWDLDGVIQS